MLLRPALGAAIVGPPEAVSNNTQTFSVRRAFPRLTALNAVHGGSASNVAYHTLLRSRVTPPPAATCKQPRPGSRSSVRTRCTGQQSTSLESEERVAQIVDGLCLAWFAARNRSLLAARCFVETVLACYQNGIALDAIKMHLDTANLQNPRARILPAKEQDLMLTWVSLVLLTLQEVGALQPTPPPTPFRWSADTLGLLGYVKSNIALHQAGTSLQQLQDLQAAANQTTTSGKSESVAVMQQNARLVLLALEVVAGLGIETQAHLSPAPPSVTTPTGYTYSFAPYLYTSSEGCDPSPVGGSGGADAAAGGDGDGGVGLGGRDAEQLLRRQQREEGMRRVVVAESGERAAAVKLLVAFMGGVLGAQHSALVFVDQVLEAYLQGVPAHRLMAEVKEEEFVQSGGLLPVGQAAYPQEVSAQLFGRWLSIVYMSFALLGVRFPNAATQLGWAWAGGATGGAPEAIGLNEFVARALQGIAADSSGAPLPAQASNLAKRLQQAGEEGRQLAESAAAGARGDVQVSEDGKMMVGGKERASFVKLPDKELETSSTVFALMKQLTDLTGLAWLKVQTQASLQASGARDASSGTARDAAADAVRQY